MAAPHRNPDVPSITTHSDENARPRKRSRHIDLDGMSSADFGLPRYGSSTRAHTPLWANLKTSEGTQSPKRDQIDPISFRDGYAQVSAGDITPTPNSVGNLTPQTPGHRDPNLHTLLHAIHRPDLFDVLLEAGVTDFWLPLPKRLASKWLKNQELANFLWHQEVSLTRDIPAELRGRHLSITDFEQLGFQETDQELDFLGAGGFGEVFRVKRQLDGQEYACKSMIRRGTYKMQRDLMLNFEREVSGMRKVQHRHCVDLVASCTSMDSVFILSSPVADVDLARFLDLDLDSKQLCVLSGAVGCIASALAYLHNLGIRHDDLKPNNVLIHGSNVLLTDFGFCLDASDTGITTTMGPPKHFTRRYSAPEVFEHAPRSRLSDIWSMGCILFDIVSRLHGYKLQELNRFWLLNGTMRDSYAENPAATEAWFTMLSDSSTPHKHASPSGFQWLLSFIKSLLLEPDRLMRPTAAQVAKRLDEASQDQLFYGHEGPLWMGSCCKLLATGSNGAVHSPLWREPLGRPSFDMFGTDIGFAQLFYDTDLRLIPCGDNVFNPGDSVNMSFGDNSDFRDFNVRVKNLLDRVDIPSQKRLSEVSQLSRAELMKSLYLHSACDIYYDNIRLRLRLEGDLESYTYTARIVVIMLQLERRPMCGVPFITLVFDPETPESGSLDQSSWGAKKEQPRYPTTLLPNGSHRTGQQDGNFSNYETTPVSKSASHGHFGPFICDVPNCKRNGKGFSTINDLDRHKKSVHRIGLKSEAYRCAADDCQTNEKVWPRLDNFKQHLQRKHATEDEQDLIQRSTYSPMKTSRIMQAASSMQTPPTLGHDHPTDNWIQQDYFENYRNTFIEEPLYFDRTYPSDINQTGVGAHE